MDKNLQTAKARELETVLKISQAVSRTLDLREILKMACRMTAQALKADRCSMGLLNTKASYEITHTSYRKKSSYPSIDGVKFNLIHYPSLAKKLLRRKAIQILLDHNKNILSRDERKLFRHLSLKVFLAVPIMADGIPLGAFHLARVEESIPFSSSDINLCQTIANQVGIAIRNATLLNEVKESHQQLEKQTGELRTKYEQQNLLFDLGRSLFQTLHLDELFDLIARKTCEALRIDRCTIITLDPEQEYATLRSTYLSGGKSPKKARYDSSSLGRKFRIDDNSQVFRLLQKKGLLVNKDFFSSPLFPAVKRHIRNIGVKSTIAIPFFSGDRISGVLQLSSTTDYRSFTDSEIKLCQTIANQASLALENAQLMLELQEKSLKMQEQADSLERRFKEQTILLETSKALSQTLDLKKLFDIVTQKTVELLGVDRAVAMIIDQDTGAFHLFTHFTRIEHQPELADFPESVKEFPYIVRQLKTGHILCVPNIVRSSLSSEEKEYFRRRGIRSVLSIPFILRGKLLGILGLNGIRQRREFTESEIKLARAIANQLAVAIENARLMELSEKHSRELEKLSLKTIDAQEEERKNIAGKLHDVIAQDLTATQFDLKMSRQTLPEGCAEIRTKLEEADRLVSQTLGNIRNLTSDLRPPILDDFGLSSALRWYIDNFRRRTELKISLKTPEMSCKFSPELETAIYRIIQEGLTNVTKHSKATRVMVHLYKKDNDLRIIIQDNGIGFEPDSHTFSTGFGLFRLREKTQLLGGRFKITSKKGRGTRLNIALPCPSKEKK